MRCLLLIAGLVLPLAVAGQSLLGAAPASLPWQFIGQGLTPPPSLAAGSPPPYGMLAASPEPRRSWPALRRVPWPARAEVTSHNWANASLPVTEGEFGPRFLHDRYNLGLGLATASLTSRQAALPRILPAAAMGLPYTSFGGSPELNAVGRLMLGTQDSLQVGASVGRIELLPGTALGGSGLDQKALSLGLRHGPVSGVLVGRMVQPLDVVGMGGLYNPGQRWSSLDFGVTWRLPWQGQLSLGGRNLWSSSTVASPLPAPAAATPAVPDATRTPYVQYHQDL